MNCSKCKNKMYVIDSRGTDNVTYRRYECSSCDHRVTTIERTAPDGIGLAAARQCDISVINKSHVTDKISEIAKSISDLSAMIENNTL